MKHPPHLKHPTNQPARGVKRRPWTKEQATVERERLKGERFERWLWSDDDSPAPPEPTEDSDGR